MYESCMGNILRQRTILIGVSQVCDSQASDIINSMHKQQIQNGIPFLRPKEIFNSHKKLTYPRARDPPALIQIERTFQANAQVNK